MNMVAFGSELKGEFFAQRFRKKALGLNQETEEKMRSIAERSLKLPLNNCSMEPKGWKQTVSETLQSLQIIPEKFNGRIMVAFKDGGVSYLEKSETYK